MDRYAIIKDGRNFIVRSEEQSVLKCTSRRKAAKAVADANGLMCENDAAVLQTPDGEQGRKA